MKKIFLALSIMTFSMFTTKIYANDYENMCSQIKPKKTFSGTISSISGMNLISRNVIEKQIEKALKKETNSKFDVKLNNFWGISPLGGQFSSLSIKGNDFQYQNVFFTSLNVQTLCPYNYITYKDDDTIFNENLVLKYNAQINEKDLEKTVNGLKDKFMQNIMKDELLSSLIEIKNPSAKIKNDSIKFEFEMVPFSKLSLGGLAKKAIKPIKISFSTGLKVEDGKIMLCNIETNGIKTQNPPEKLLEMINATNYLDYSFDVDKNTKGKLHVEDVKIHNSKIDISGYITVPKEQ